jgi:hypothetical protein
MLKNLGCPQVTATACLGTKLRAMSLAVAQAKVPGQVQQHTLCWEDTEHHQVGCQDPTFDPQVASDGRPHYRWACWQ